METMAAQGASGQGPTQVCEPGLFGKAMAVFLILLFGGTALFVLATAASALAGGGGGPGLAAFLVFIAGVQLALLYYLWPTIDAMFRLRIAVGQGVASFRLPARRKEPAQPAYTFTIPLEQIERLATRIELIHGMGQIQRMRQFAIKANGQWIEYGGAVENSYNGMVGATGRVALSAVEALQRATGMQIEDLGVVEGARKGVAPTPWGAASLAAPVATEALAKADKNAGIWRIIILVAFAVIVAVRALDWFVR